MPFKTPAVADGTTSTSRNQTTTTATSQPQDGPKHSDAGPLDCTAEYYADQIAETLKALQLWDRINRSGNCLGFLRV
jgi:hypothetical protein